MEVKKCSVDWCKNNSKCKGFCQKHYDQMRLYGKVKPDVVKSTICSFPGCGRKLCAKGLCNTHWAQMSRHGKLTSILTEDTIEDRFWKLVQKGETQDDCWLWLGPETGKFAAAGKQGYGQLYWQGKKWMAHRLSYVLLRGNISNETQLDHLCRNRMCVNPDHLEPVTQRENIKRMHAYWALVKEIERLRELVISLGGNPDADLLAVSKLRTEREKS